MKKIDYFLARQMIFFFGGFWFVGTLPRMVGIIQTKPEFLNMVAIIDTVSTVGFFGAIFYSVYAVLHNAKLRQNEAS